jgi:hypothetical protein
MAYQNAGAKLRRNIDRAFAILLMLGAVGHTLGSFKAYGTQPIALLWSLCASVLCVLLGTINLLRTNRSQDTALAWICTLGSLCWLIIMIIFGTLIGNLLDVRIVIFSVLSAGLVLFSLRTVGTASRTA